MDTESWRAISRTLDELDAMRVQVRQGQSADRTVRFYDLIRRSLAATERGGVVGHVIEFAGGCVICHWPHDPKYASYYTSILAARAVLCADGTFFLSLTDVSERTTPAARANTELTKRERQVVDLVSLGHSNDEIAVQLHLANSTIKGTLRHIFTKVGVHDRLQLALLARDLNLATLPDAPPEDVAVDP